MLALLYSDIQSRFLSAGKVTGVEGGDGGESDGIAYLKSDGDDGTGVVGFPASPYLTLDAAVAALGEAGTVELLDNVFTNALATVPYNILVQGAFELVIDADTTMLLDGLTVGTATCNIVYPPYEGVGQTNVGTITLANGCVLSFDISGAPGAIGENGQDHLVFAADGINGADATDNASDGSPGGDGDNAIAAAAGTGGMGGGGHNARDITVLGVGSISNGFLIGGHGADGGPGGLAVSEGGTGGTGGGGYHNGTEYETDGGSGGSGGNGDTATGGVGGDGGSGGNGGTLYYAATVTPRDNVQYQYGGAGAGGAGGAAYSVGGGRGYGGSGVNLGGEGQDGTSTTATPGSAGMNGSNGNPGGSSQV